MLRERVQQVLDAFDSNLSSVQALMRFDRDVLQYAIQQLSVVEGKLEDLHEFSGARRAARTGAQLLVNIQTNDSLRPQYAQMLNQCNVLLVSYFSGAVGDVFRVAVSDAVRTGRRPAVLKEDIRIGLRDIRDIGPELIERSGELLAAHRDISFQDMQSIGKAFREYFNYDVVRDETVNDIIVSQACRHVLVHSGGVVDRKMVGQVRSAQPRTLKPDLVEGERVQFSESEIDSVANQMRRYLSQLSRGVGEASDGH
jgi:hypothetical protein